MSSDSRLTILLYHGVYDTRPPGIVNYSGKHIGKSEFLKQMRQVQSSCTLLSMDEVVRHFVHQVPFPPNSVAITFDDGFENNFSVAAPILDDFGIPATFYISTGIVDTKQMFWVDQIEDCIQRYSGSSIQLEVFSDPFTTSSSQAKIFTIETIKRLCKSVPMQKVNSILFELIDVTGIVPTVDSCAIYQKITWEQLRSMHTNPLFIIGGHSHTHSILSQVPLCNAAQEISLSIELLQTNLSMKHVTHYSYPEGQREHYNQDIIALLKTAGITCCPSAIDGDNDLQDSLFELKRIMVGFMDRPFPF